MPLWEGLEISARIPRRKKNSVIEEAKHVGAIFAARPCAGRGNVGVVAKQNPSLKSMEPAQIKYYKDLLLIEELRRWTFAGEAARNIGPDTPEKKFGNRRSETRWCNFCAARPCVGRGMWCGCAKSASRKQPGIASGLPSSLLILIL